MKSKNNNKNFNELWIFFFLKNLNIIVKPFAINIEENNRIVFKAIKFISALEKKNRTKNKTVR